MKVLVTGNAGSGKTTFSKELSKQLKLPLHGLDTIVWKPGWRASSAEERRDKIGRLLSADSWIIDGVSSLAFDAADVVVFLDIPIHRCLLNIAKRVLVYKFRTRESLPEGCPEIVGGFKATKIAFTYQRVTRPILLRLISDQGKKRVFWIRNYRELADMQNDILMAASKP